MKPRGQFIFTAFFILSIANLCSAGMLNNSSNPYVHGISTVTTNDVSHGGQAVNTANSLEYDPTFASPTPQYLFLQVANTGGTTAYWFTGGVANQSGRLWTGFMIDLGAGTGTTFQVIIPVPDLAFDARASDFTDFNSYSPPPVYTAGSIGWPNLAVNMGGPFNFDFYFDVPDATTNYDFTLRFSPLVPEPATGVALLAMGLLTLLPRRPGCQR